VNRSYAAATIEKLLLIRSKTDPSSFVFNSQTTDMELVGLLLSGLVELLQQEKNYYAMRTLYRAVLVADSRIGSHADSLGSIIAAFIKEAMKDPSGDPNYSYLLFETTALAVRNLKGDQANLRVL